MIKLVFGAIIAIVLLALYVYAIVYAILAVHGLADKNLTAGIVTVLDLVGGLIAALVIAELAITKPNEVPGARFFAANPPPAALKAVKVISVIYISVWVLCGLASLVVGYLQHPDVVPALTTAGKSWLGLAVAAAYSYLGIKP